MLLAHTRQGIVRACRKLSAAGLVVGTAGNVSAREGDLVAVTPSGVDYADMSAGQVGVHRLDGTPVDAPLKPTSELPLHLAVYAATGAGAVVHTHSPAATAVSTLAEELPPIHYYVAMFGGTVRVAPYATYGTDELARNVVSALDCRTACLMGSHGAVTTGADLKTAHERAVYLEWLCDVYLRAASAGTPRLLPPGEIEAVARKLASYGQLLRARHGRLLASHILHPGTSLDDGVRVRVGAFAVAMAHALAQLRALPGRGDGAVAVAGHAYARIRPTRPRAA